MVKKKGKSKRQTLQQKYKIERRVKEVCADKPELGCRVVC